MIILTIRDALAMECVDHLVQRAPGKMPWLGLESLRPGRRALRPPSIHQRDGPHPGHQGERLGGTRRCGLERRALVVQEDLRCLPQVFHEMEPIDDLHSVGSPLANTIAIECTTVTTDHRLPRSARAGDR